MKKYMTYGGRSFAAGGAMPMEQLTEFNEGGRHEENSLGGIPQGMNPDGQMNLVEEGETKFDAENYIYSDTLKVDKELAEAFNLSPKMVGKTFADASKMAGRKKSKREGDAIEEAANTLDLENLMDAQEAFKQARIEEKLQEIAELDPNALPALMGQGQPQGGPQGDPAMGGEMQEAPMDEQAMMEQQMMAEQQGGGGQPSPEEMAMMEQQQNQMMGQQEGMMRSGGKLPKEVLKARVQSHMSPAQANAYIKSYAGGGYMNRSMRLGGPGDKKNEESSRDNYGDSASTRKYSKDPQDDNYKPIDKFGQTNSPRTKDADRYIASNMGVNGPLTRRDTIGLNRISDMYIEDYDMKPYLYGYGSYDSEGEVIIPKFSNPGRFPMTEDGYTGTEFWEMGYPDQARDDARAKKYVEERKKEEAFNAILKKEGFFAAMDSVKKDSVKNRNGGYTRSYNPGGFMGMNMANAGMMNTGAVGTSADPKGCPCANGSLSTACCSRDYDKFDEGVYKEKFDGSGDKIAISNRNAGFRNSSKKLPFRHRQSLKNADVNYSQQVSGTDGGTRGSLMEDSNMSQNYANIDMSQYTPEQQELMQGKLWATDPNTWAQVNPGILNKKDQKQMSKVSSALNWTPKAKNTDFIITDFDREKNPNLTDKGIIYNAKRRQAGKPIKNLTFDRDIPGLIKTYLHPHLQGMKYVPQYVRQDGLLEGHNKLIWDEDKGVKIKTKEFGGNLMQSGQEVGLNPMQGMNQVMRSGGKMCYGCGGAMHNYGGYMNNMPGKKFEFGAGLEVASNVLDKASTFMPPVFKEVAKTASNITGTMADKKQGKPVTTGDYIGDVIGGATASIPGADKFVDTITDVATSKNKARQEEILDDARNNPNDPRHKQVVDQDIAMANSKQLQNANKFNNVLDSTLGVATQFINPGEATEDIMDTIPTENVDDIPDLNFARYGKKLYGKGGGLWANIHNKRARIAAGSGEKMRKPGSKGAPTAEALKNSQNAMGGRMYNSGGYMSPMFAGPEINDEEVAGIVDQSTNDDGTYGGDMNSAFIDMSMNANPTDLISPMYNLGMGLFGKDADTSYDIEKYTYKPFDFTQTKNALRRQTAKAINQLGRKGTGNPSNLLALSQIGSKLEADYLAKAENINTKREQAAIDKNTKAKNAYEKEQKELELKQQTIKDELIKAGLQDIKSISDKNAQTEYMFKFMQAMAPDVVKGSYKNMSKMFMDIFKQKNSKKK